MPPMEADLQSAHFEGDTLVTAFTVRSTQGTTRVTAVRLAEATPGASGEVVVLQSIDAIGVELSPGRAWEGRFAWPQAASARVRAVRRAVVLLVADAEKPIGLAFRIDPAPSERATSPARGTRWRLVPLFVLLALVAALAVARCRAGWG